MKVGRTDLQRSHRALSTVLWGSLLIVVFLVIGFRWWLFAVEPGDIVRIANVEAAQKGDWVVVDGLIDGHFDYQPRFLVNAESGAFLKVAHGGWMNYMDVAISGDGTTAAWLEPAGKESWRLVSAQLGERAATRTNTDLFFSAPAGLRLSERGDRIAALESRVVSIYEMKTGRLILAAPMKEDERVGLARWISDDVLRLYSSVNLSLLRAAEVVITEIDVSAGSVAVRGSLEIEYDDPAPDGVRNRRWLRSDPARDRLLDIQRQPDGWWWSFRDAATGTLIVDLGKRDSYRALAFLSDGRFVHPVVDDEGIWLHVSSSGGEFESRTFLGEGSRAMFGGEVEPGVLTLAVNRDESDSWESGRWEAMVVDVDQRTTRGIPGLGLPAEWIQVYQTGVLGSSRLFFEGDDRLVDWDPVTGEQRVVF